MADSGIIWPPVPIFRLAESLGVKVESDGSEHWSGAAQFDADTREATIWYNRDDPKAHQRFAVALGLAHILLDPIGAIYRDAPLDSPKGRVETPASRFAAALLMPDWMMDDVLVAYRHDSEAITRALQVPRFVLSVRLRRLFRV